MPFFQVVKMVADGNCLLHALAYDGGLESPAALAVVDRGEEMRLELIDFLSSHAERQGPFQETWLEEAEYLQRGPESAWAGHVAILAYSLMARRRVRVHTRHANFTVTEADATHEDLQDEPNLPIVHVLYNGVDHYDLLLEIGNDEGTEPAWEGQPLPARYIVRRDDEEPRPPPPKKARVDQESEAADEVDPTEAELEDVMEEVSRAAVAATSDHPHRELENAIKQLADTRIRDKPTLPRLASNDDADSGAAWPHAFCAFRGCMWTCCNGTEEDLQQHLADQHAAELQPLAELLPVRDDSQLLSVYNAAISVKCRAQAPIAGSSLDRIALDKFAAATAKDNVESLVCFSCACTYTRVADNESKGAIRWHRPARPANGSFLGRPVHVMRKLLGMEEFMAKYNELEGGSSLSDFEDFSGWQLSVTDAGGNSVRLLGCPEDHRCAANPEHVREGKLCKHCEIPICETCYQHLAGKKSPELPPLSLANDMWSGYGPETLYNEKVTIMEMLCASPCITTLICLTMEARYRDETVEGPTKPLDDTVHMARHRRGARGNALTFPMPWEDLLQKLQQQTGPGAAALPRSPQELCGIVRVILTTNKEGKTTQAEIKNLIHQASVRRHVVVKLILDMKRYGHPSFQALDEQQVVEKAALLPEDGVPPELVKIFDKLDDSQEKLQPQKAATPTDGMQTLDQAPQGCGVV